MDHLAQALVLSSHCLNRECNPSGLLLDFLCNICVLTELVDVTRIKFYIELQYIFDL